MIPNPSCQLFLDLYRAFDNSIRNACFLRLIHIQLQLRQHILRQGHYHFHELFPSVPDSLLERDGRRIDCKLLLGPCETRLGFFAF